MIDELKLKVTEVHSKFIANPKATLRRLHVTLHIDCSAEYLHTSAERKFASVSQSIAGEVDSIPHRQGVPQHAEVQTSAETLFPFVTEESLTPINQGIAYNFGTFI